MDRAAVYAHARHAAAGAVDPRCEAPWRAQPARQPGLHTRDPIFQTNRPICLASASPRRRAFFDKLRLDVLCIRPPAEAEPAPRPNEEATRYCLRAALAKARAVLPLLPETAGQGLPAPVVIAADTIVVLDGHILGKPENQARALSMLSSLNGKTHCVTTGCALLCSDWQRPRVFAVHSRVTLWDCPAALLKSYARSGEPLDKAGAYAVQGAGAFLVKSIEGSWSNVVGLPLAELTQTLLQAGVLELRA